MTASVRRLDEVCAVTMGQAPKGESYNSVGDGWPLIAGAGDFNDGRPQAKKFTSAPSKLSIQGDILIGIRASIGDKVIADREYCLGRGVAGLRPFAQLDSRYLWHWLTESAPTLALKGRGATFKQVSRQDIGEMQIPLPPLTDQRRIAGILDQADTLRARRRQAISYFDELGRATFFEMFERDPRAWPLVPVSEVCDLVVDCVNRTAPIAKEPTPYKMIRTTNVKNGRVDLTNVRFVERDVFLRWNRRATPRRGDVLLTREAPVGESGIIDTNDDVFLGQRLMLYRVDSRRMTPEYLLASFNSHFLLRQFDRAGSGSTVKHLSLPDCRSFIVQVPPIGLQREFSQKINHMNRVKDLQTSQLKGAEVLSRSLQARAFVGDL